MSPKILRMRLRLLECAPEDVRPAACWRAFAAGVLGVAMEEASSLCWPGRQPRREISVWGRFARTPKMPQAHRFPSGIGAAAFFKHLERNPPLPSVEGPRTWARLARSGRAEGAI